MRSASGTIRKVGAFGNTANTLSLITNGYNFGRGGCSSTRRTFSRGGYRIFQKGGGGGGGGRGETCDTVAKGGGGGGGGTFIPGRRVEGAPK